jgi:histone H3/H4
MGLVVKSKIKEYTELNVGEEFSRAFEKKVEDLLKDAEERAKANGRKTIYARDI